MIVAGVRVAHVAEPPAAAAAVVREDDTYLVLSAPPLLSVAHEHPIRLFQALHALAPLAPGTVVVRAGTPLRMLAVVHDLELDPSWRREWVEAALDAVFAESERRGLRTLASELLGSVHGRLPRAEAVALTLAALARQRGAGLEALWLLS